MGFENLLEAIVDDDTQRVAALLAADARLAQASVAQARLYDECIFHWLYAGDTALHLAAAGYRTSIVEQWLAAGADVNAQANHRRSTPLHYAADGFITHPAWDAVAQVATLRCLLAAGADLHAQDRNGATALHRAVRTRCAAAVIELLAVGADPRVRNRAGSTPFHLAVQDTGRGGSGAPLARQAQAETVTAFLAAGVSADLPDARGRTVHDCARSDPVRALLAGAAPSQAD